MYALPVELVLKTLENADASTIQTLRYTNRRISAIMNKYMQLFDVKELRIGESKETVEFYDRSRAVVYPTENMPEKIKEISLNLKNKIFHAERLLLTNRRFNRKTHLRILIENYPNLRIVKELHLNECLKTLGITLATIIQRYNVESLVIKANSPGTPIYLNSVWKEIMNINITLKHISITASSHYYFNEGFLTYIRAKQVHSVKISGFLFSFQFEAVLKEIQVALDEKRQINWCIAFGKIVTWVTHFQLLDDFLTENANMNFIISESEKRRNGNTQQILTIKFATGQIIFYMPDSFVKWNREPLIKKT